MRSWDPRQTSTQAGLSGNLAYAQRHCGHAARYAPGENSPGAIAPVATGSATERSRILGKGQFSGTADHQCCQRRPADNRGWCIDRQLAPRKPIGPRTTFGASCPVFRYRAFSWPRCRPQRHRHMRRSWHSDWGGHDSGRRRDGHRQRFSCARRGLGLAKRVFTKRKCDYHWPGRFCRSSSHHPKRCHYW